MARAIGIDIGGTNVRAGVVASDGAIENWLTLPSDKSPRLVLDQVLLLVQKLSAGDAVAIGIGLPGRVDAKRGVALSGGYVNFAGVPVAATLAEAFGKPVAVENDGTMALIAEVGAGQARGARNVVMLTIGTGIGGAVMVEGEVLRGNATAGQLGHLTVDMDGLLCACGRRGCIETKSSGTALTRLMAEAGFPAGTKAEDLVLDSATDAKAAPVLSDWARPLRCAIDSLVAVAAPELVILGGGLGAVACKALTEHPAPSSWFQCPITPALLGDKAGVIGAGLAAHRLERGQI